MTNPATAQMTWVVTGAAGFIGSNLCAELLEAGHRVVGVDNFFTGKRENIDRLEKQAGSAFSFAECDIRDREALDGVFTDCHVLVHLAAQVSVQRSIDFPDETNAINVDGFLNVYQAALAIGVRRFIYASSCAVYGDSEELPLSEGTRPSPLSPYAVSKLANELYAAVLMKANPEMVAVGLRFFNIFGPWQDHEGGYAAVIPRWADACLEGTPPVIFGDGSATRDFCFVGNVCRQIILMGAAKAAPLGDVYNIGTGVGTSLNELFEVIYGELEAAGKELAFENPEYQPWRQGDIVHSLGDIARARQDLSFDPRDDLRAGIRILLADQYRLSAS